ncbi:MAG: helix-turn-helix domain-containing protein [Gammaproteobacteria bacterium]|nr:helix-turn-helix domain-containing protein [Gammaproteobacteria bacterium]
MADNATFLDATSGSLRAELGMRLARQRLARNVTQEALADTAGIGLRTLRRVEAGEPSSVDSVLRVVIALGLADGLMAGIPTLDVRPIERVASRGRERRRARPSRSRMSDESWSWSDGPDD